MDSASGMIRPRFLSEPDRRALLACVKRQREDHGIARRANALLLLDEDKSCAEIAEFLYLDDDMVRGWYTQYLAEGREVTDNFRIISNQNFRVLE